jgi:hypothetical protein
VGCRRLGGELDALDLPRPRGSDLEHEPGGHVVDRAPEQTARPLTRRPEGQHLPGAGSADPLRERHTHDDRVLARIEPGTHRCHDTVHLRPPLPLVAVNLAVATDG